MTSGAPGVVLRMLGPLEVLAADGSAVDIGSPRHRETLAALAVDLGRVVSTDTLLARVWGDSPRGGTVASLQAVISRLRSRLAEAGVLARIVTAPPGYRLEADDDATDVARLVAGLEAARRILPSTGPAAAREELARALAWWRGEPLADVPQQFARTEAARLEGLRLTGEELAAELDLTLGRNAAATTRLQELSDLHPLRESVRAQLMRALYLDGRQGEALAQYGLLRELLADELGVDPGPIVREMHQRILEHDPALRPMALPQSAAGSDDAGLPPGAAGSARSGSARSGSGSARSAPETAGSSLGDANRAGSPSAALGRERSNLPATDLLGELIGRERDVAYLVDLLTQPTSRLITITGVGGCGKTRLGLAAAARAADRFTHGATLVPLAPLTGADAVIPAIARAVGVAEGGDPFSALLDLLRDRSQLLLLDNAEHLLDAWPEVATLAAACPGLRILVTSRIGLRVRGEVLFALAPLDLPASIELFVTRAAAVRPQHQLDRDDPVIAGLCTRLAGIPLAVELAAARVRLLDPASIASRLDEVMAAEGARDLPPRQRTMRAAIDWSFHLLDPVEQAAFARLAVFTGGFGIDAAARVLDGLVAEHQVFGLLDSLVEQSLLVGDETEQGLRFRLLEPVAQYARTRLDADEEHQARNAHLAHFADLAAHYEPLLRGQDTVATLALLERDHANLIAAIEWALASDQAEQAGWLGWHLWLFWWVRGALREGRRLMERVLEAEVSDPVRVRAGAVVGALAFAQGDLDGAEIWSESARLARATGDLGGLPYAFGGTGLVALARDEVDSAAAIYRETITLCDEAGLHGQWLWTLSHVWLGTTELLRGRLEAAAELVETALTTARERDDPLAIYIALFTAVQISMGQGEPGRARTQIAEGVLLSRETGDHANLAYFFEALACVEAMTDGHEQVGLLRGAAAQLRAGVGGNVYGYYRPDESLIAAAEEAARATLGSPRYREAVERGASLDLDAMVALAVGGH